MPTRTSLAATFLASVMCLFGCNEANNPPAFNQQATQQEETPVTENSETVSNVPTNELSEQWREASESYVSALNAFVERGQREGWENVKDEDEPKDTRQPLASAVLNAIRKANEAGDVEKLHKRFPRAHGPFIDMLEENGQSLPVVILLDDGRIVTRIGSPWESGRVVVIDDREISELGSEVITVGRSPNRRIFALATKAGVSIRHGWDSPDSAMLPWPTGKEGMPAGFEVEAISGTPTVTALYPFDSGDKVLLVSPEGVFVLDGEGADRLLPTKEQLQEHFEWLRKEYPEDSLSYDLSMDHGSISPDGKWIAAGHQSSLHYIFDASTLEIVGEVGHLSEYPHYAAFSADSSMVALNSCHFYNGETVGVPTKLLPGLETEPYEPDNRLTVLEEGSRVYAAVARSDEFIIGDASGYLRAFDLKGNFRWQHFIGSSVGDIDISGDGKRLVVTTYAGFLSILDLDTGTADPFAIGTSTHQERRRWLFWKKEAKPLIW